MYICTSSSRPLSRLTGCLWPAVTEVTRETFKCLFCPPQRPPHLISSLEGPCGSIAGLASPLRLTHTHRELCSRSFRTSCPSWQVQSGPTHPLCVSVRVCVIWDIMRLLDPSVSCMSTTAPVVRANNRMPTWAGWSTDNPEVKQVFQSLCSLVCNLLCLYSLDTLLSWATTLYTTHRLDNVDTSCADGPLFWKPGDPLCERALWHWLWGWFRAFYYPKWSPCGPLMGSEQGSYPETPAAFKSGEETKQEASSYMLNTKPQDKRLVFNYT